MGDIERVHNFIKWHRGIRAQIIEAQLPGVEEEATSIKWIIRGIATHQHYDQLESAWRDTGSPSSISELEAIMLNEKAEVDRQKKMDKQMQNMLKQVSRQQGRHYYNNNQHQHNNNPQQKNNNQNQQPARIITSQGDVDVDKETEDVEDETITRIKARPT